VGARSVSAVFSPCRTWRYTLTRETLVYHEERVGVTVRARAPRTVAFIGLNPSTADETVDDPTVRRCVEFARRWGFERMVMLNAFAFRATDPKLMKRADDPIGPNNDLYIKQQASECDLVVACWGNHALWHPKAGHPVTRQAEVMFALAEVGVTPTMFRRTKLGAPNHPLYLCKDLDPVPWIA
jgi:hypothetical protein